MQTKIPKTRAPRIPAGVRVAWARLRAAGEGIDVAYRAYDSRYGWARIAYYDALARLARSTPPALRAARAAAHRAAASRRAGTEMALIHDAVASHLELSMRTMKTMKTKTTKTTKTLRPRATYSGPCIVHTPPPPPGERQRSGARFAAMIRALRGG